MVVLIVLIQYETGSRTEKIKLKWFLEENARKPTLIISGAG